MLLTLKPPAQNGIKGPNEYSIVRQSIPTPRSSPSMSETNQSTPAAPKSTAPRHSVNRSMDSSRRGLPPPSSMTLPPPDINRPAMTQNSVSQGQSQSQLPPPPQWQSSEESMRHWLQAHAEEDKRRQEEERTRQETLRLEQKRVQQNNLRDMLQAGIPPHLIPTIFAGMSGSLYNGFQNEHGQFYFIQHQPGVAPPRYIPQEQAGVDMAGVPTLPSLHPLGSHQRSHSAASPDLRRDSRAMHPNPYAIPHQQQGFAGQGASPQQPLTMPSGSPPNQPPARPTLPVPDTRATLQHPQINLNHAQYAPGSSIPPPHPGPIKVEPHQGQPSINFLHWIPPGQQHPNTQAGRVAHESVLPSQAQYQSPGRKRKAQGPHTPAPIPSTRPSDGNTSSSQVSRQGSPVGGNRKSDPKHHRHRSDASYAADQHSNQPSPTHGLRPILINSRDASPVKGQDRDREDEGYQADRESRPELSAQHSLSFGSRNGNGHSTPVKNGDEIPANGK